MAPQYSFPDSSPPSTPDRTSRQGTRSWEFNEPSTTPAGPPPADDTIASFTPAGAPSYLGSSILPDGQSTIRSSRVPNTNSTSFSRNLFSQTGDSTRTPPKNLFGQSSAMSNSASNPLGRSIYNREIDTTGHHHSELNKQFFADSQYDELPLSAATRPMGTFAMNYDEDDEVTDHEDINNEEPEGDDNDAGFEYAQDNYVMDQDNDNPLPDLPVPHLEDDNMLDLMSAAATANQKILEEAEDLYRASTKFPTLQIHREMVYAREAKDLHEQAGFAPLRESQDIILRTEDLITRAYDEGVGALDDPSKLENTLAAVAIDLNSVWLEYEKSMEGEIDERAPAIGPGPEADPFKKARWLGCLALEMHHTKFTNDFGMMAPSLPEIMVDWMKREHDVLTSAQIAEVNAYRPSPACNQFFWHLVINAVARGMVSNAVKLLSSAGWEHVRTQGNRGDLMYADQALVNLRHAVSLTVEMLENCPGAKDNWDILGNEWTLFRVKAKNMRDQLTRFAEGQNRIRGLGASRLDESLISLSNLSREAESKVPWDVYMRLQNIFDIVLGKEAVILEACQDWCEASVALMAWFDEGVAGRAVNLGLSQNLSRSMQIAQPQNTPENYTKRLSRCFHVAVEEFPLNPTNPDEYTYACAFEANFEGVISGLRMWSLPIASAVAEVASLGGWLPRPEPKSLIVMESLDQEDLELLGMESRGPDETDGLKDTTLVEYAKEVAGVPAMRTNFGGRDMCYEGWEIAVEMLGRMDSRIKSEELVAQVLENVREKITPQSASTVEKVWSILNALGMINLAEETVESFADLLAKESHNYGEALWYYALAHRPNKVREILNLLISYSLIESAAFPPTSELDAHLQRLLSQRAAALEQLAATDLEAAELLGKMLAGYATLRKFYDLRDGVDSFENGSSSHGQAPKVQNTRQQAAAALTAVIASSDDNIRGGLYDNTRDAVVSEDFLLALLGEALVFLHPSAGTNILNATSSSRDEPDLTLEQLDVLFKAVEDIQTVGKRVYDVAEDFFDTVVAGSPASNPMDLLARRSTGDDSVASSFVTLSGSSIFASQLHKSIHRHRKNQSHTERKRGWDWRQGLRPGMKAKDVLKILRLGLSREVGRLWVLQADSIMW